MSPVQGFADDKKTVEVNNASNVVKVENDLSHLRSEYNELLKRFNALEKSYAGLNTNYNRHIQNLHALDRTGTAV